MSDQYPEQGSQSNRVWIAVQSPEDEVPDFSEHPHHYPGRLLEGTEAAEALAAYEEAGRGLRAPRIPEDELIVADGVLFHANFGTGDEWGVYRDRLDPEATATRLGDVGKYTINDGKIAFTNEEGRLIATRATPDNVRALEYVGYMRRTIPVPFCNGNLPPQGSMADLQLHLLEALDQQDALSSGGRPITVDLLNVTSPVPDAAALATRGVTQLETEEGHDRRVTDEMDPDRPAELTHAIQALRDEIALRRMTELGT